MDVTAPRQASTAPAETSEPKTPLAVHEAPESPAQKPADEAPLSATEDILKAEKAPKTVPKAPGSTVPVGAIVGTIVVMLILSAAAVAVYLQG